MFMSSVKAVLSVILKADDVIVAEVEDPALWQRVLTAINMSNSELTPGQPQGPKPFDAGGNGAELSRVGSPGTTAGTGPLEQLAQQVGVEVAVIQGACSPLIEAPYMHLDLHCWEEMKKQLPMRGTTSVASTAVAATLLALWFSKSGLASPTQAQVKQVLSTINITDKNANRSIQNTSWLQGRPGGQIVLNPAEISKSIKMAKCFCSKDWSAWNESVSS
jgi:hypothetical protein